MATASATPVMNRMFLSMSLPPIAVGIALALLGFAFYFGVELATGQFAAVLNGTAEAHIPMH